MNYIQAYKKEYIIYLHITYNLEYKIEHKNNDITAYKTNYNKKYKIEHKKQDKLCYNTKYMLIFSLELELLNEWLVKERLI